jgi:hypothetical protein
MSQTHFVDTNILIANTINWDNHFSHITQLFQLHDTEFITSNLVREECRKVLQNLRKITSRYMRDLFNKVDSNNPLQLDHKIMQFCYHYCDNLHRDNDKGAIRNFTQYFLQKIKNLLVNEIETDQEDFIQSIADSISKALSIFLSECNSDYTAKIVSHTCPHNCCSIYETENKSLRSAIDCENDVCILLDAYYLKNKKYQSGLMFTTFDRNHIIGNKNLIESLLTGLIVFFPS